MHAATVGNWRVQLSDGAAFFGVTTSLNGQPRTRVLRRYREFAKLHRELRKSNKDVPNLPPRSLMRKERCPAFMEQRRQGLHAFLAAVVASDSHLVGAPQLRAFLGLPEAVPKKCPGVPQAVPEKRPYVPNDIVMPWVAAVKDGQLDGSVSTAADGVSTAASD